MEFQILDIEPGRGDNDVLVTVGYWYHNGARKAKAAPDYVEHHQIVGVRLRQPKRNRLGQFYDHRGWYVDPWVEVDGDWVPMEPDPNLHQMEDVPIAFRILEPLQLQAWAVDRERPVDGGLLRGDELREIRSGNKKGHFAHSPEVQGLKGFSKRVEEPLGGGG